MLETDLQEISDIDILNPENKVMQKANHTKL